MTSGSLKSTVMPIVVAVALSVLAVLIAVCVVIAWD
jgi:hypothetical protein